MSSITHFTGPYVQSHLTVGRTSLNLETAGSQPTNAELLAMVNLLPLSAVKERDYGTLVIPVEGEGKLDALIQTAIATPGDPLNKIKGTADNLNLLIRSHEGKDLVYVNYELIINALIGSVKALLARVVALEAALEV